MTQDLRYKLTIGADDDADVEDIENFLQQLLLDLYEQGQVESIKVTKRGERPTEIKEIPALVQIINELKSRDIKDAIETVKEMEDMNNDE